MQQKIKSCIYACKDFGRKIPAIALANRLLKARQLKSGLARLNREYAAAARAKGLAYKEAAAWQSARQAIATLHALQQSRRHGRLRVFWFGACRDQDESGFLQALRQLVDVVEFRNCQGGYGPVFTDQRGRIPVYDPVLVQLNDASLHQQIQQSLHDGGVDLLMGQMWANHISASVLMQVRELGVPVINVSMDDRLPDNWSFRLGTRMGAVGLAPVSDLILTTSRETCTWFAVEGAAAVFWPLASDPSVFTPPPDAVRDIDVLFIGNNYGIRGDIVNRISQQGVSITCYGSNWPNGPASAEQSAALFKRAKIVLGIGTVGYCYDVFTLKLRDFDAPMSGALYLTHRNDDLNSLYEEDVDIACYSTPEEAGAKIKHYLANPALLQEVAASGHRKALARDTWQHRLRTTFEELGLGQRLP